MTDHATILILGGSGRVGRETAEYLLSNTAHDVVLGSRRPNTASRGTHGDRLSHQIVDVFDAQSLAEQCKRADVVISCVGPSGVVGSRVARACKAVETAYIDSGGYDPLLTELERLEGSETTRVPLVVDVGILPGLSGIFPQYVLDECGAGRTPCAIEVDYVGRDAWSLSSAWDIVHGLGDFGHERGFCFLEGANLRRVPMTQAMRAVEFPDPIGAVRVGLIYSEELLRLAQSHGVPNLKVYGANLGPRATMVCVMAKVLRLYRGSKRIDAAARLLVRASTRDMKTLDPIYGIRVGIRFSDGTIAGGMVTLSDTYRATGATLGVTARAMLEGKGPAPGVWLLHEALASRTFMDLWEAELRLDASFRLETWDDVSPARAHAGLNPVEIVA